MKYYPDTPLLCAFICQISCQTLYDQRSSHSKVLDTTPIMYATIRYTSSDYIEIKSKLLNL